MISLIFWNFYVFRILINTQKPQKPVVKKPAKRVPVHPSAGKKSEDELDTAHETQVAGTCYDSTCGFYPRFHGPKEIEIKGVFMTFRRLKVGQNKHVERYFSVEIEATPILFHINMVWISATVDGWRRVVETRCVVPRPIGNNILDSFIFAWNVCMWNCLRPPTKGTSWESSWGAPK